LARGVDASEATELALSRDRRDGLAEIAVDDRGTLRERELWGMWGV
jgi:hypothetical protein